MISDLATIFKVSRRTIERWFDDWAEIGVDSFSISEERGVKTLLKEYFIEVSEQLELHNRNLNNYRNSYNKMIIVQIFFIRSKT